jgi:hypothetical protein
METMPATNNPGIPNNIAYTYLFFMGPLQDGSPVFAEIWVSVTPNPGEPSR